MKGFLQTGLIWLGSLGFLSFICRIYAEPGTIFAVGFLLLGVSIFFLRGTHNMLLPVAIALGLWGAFLAERGSDVTRWAMALVLVAVVLFTAKAFNEVEKRTVTAFLGVALLVATTAAGVVMGKGWTLLPMGLLLWIWFRLQQEDERPPAPKPLPERMHIPARSR